MTSPESVSSPARRRSALVLGLSVGSLVLTVLSALMVWGWTAFSSMEGNAAAGWALLILVPLGWFGVIVGTLLAVAALIVAIVKRAAVVLPIVATAIAVVIILLGIATGYGLFLTGI